MAKKTAWYVCPNCRSRVAVSQDHVDEIRCQNCSTLLRPAKHHGGTVPSERGATRRAAEDDEYRLAPVSSEQPSAPRKRLAGAAPSTQNPELEQLRARRERLPDADTSTPAQAHQVDLPALPLEAEIRDDQRYKPEPPPRWTFFSRVFTYPWRPQSLLPWLVLSIGIAMLGAACHMIIAGLMSGAREGVVMAGFFILGLVWLLVLTGSYAAACLFAITETTAYNFDAPYDWPEPDWRERFVHFLWVGWCAGLPAALLVVPVSLASNELQGRALAMVIGVGLLFPIFVLSTLETNSLVPFSGPVWRSLLREVAAWITFYVLSTVVLGLSGAAGIFLYGQFGLISLVALGPLWAASILIYARLLGRLAWRIMRPGELQLQAWRQAHQSNLAGDMRARKAADDDALSDLDVG